MAATTRRRKSRSPTPARPATTPRRILVAEDSPTQAQQLRLLLEDAGYKVEVVRDGREGLEHIRAHAPDLVISDVVMPGMDGYEFCQALKASPATRRIPFVLLTGRRTPADIIHGLQRGADNFITKPFDDEYLLGRVKRIFDNLEQRQRGRFEMDVHLRVGGRELVLNADKQQIVELLFATSEELADANDHLEKAKETIEEYARTLEERVEERTRQLAEAEEKYRTLVENMPAVTYVAAIEKEGALFYVSPQGQRLLGLPSLDLLSDAESFRRYLHPDDAEGVLAEKALCNARGAPFRGEYRVLTLDGRTLWVRDEAVPIAGEAGRPAFYQGVLLDITEKKHAEQRLATQYLVTQILAESPSLTDATQRTLETLCASLGWPVAGLWEIDPARGALRITARWSRPESGLQEFLEASRELSFARGQGVPGRVWSTGKPVWVPDVKDEAEFLGAEVPLRCGLRSALSVPVIGEKGVLGVIELFAREISRPDEELLFMLAAIGGQLGIFLERRRAEQELADGQRLFQAILDSTPAVIFVSDLHGRHVLGNRAHEIVVGRPESEIRGKTAHELFPPGVADRMLGEDRGVLEQRQPIEVEESVETPRGRRNFRTIKFPLLDAAGTPYAVCGIATDVTEERQAREELERQRTTLAQTEKLAAMGSLLAGVAHELNNPLSVIIGQTGLLKRVVEGKASERADKIAQAAERCARIVKNFLALARQRPTEKQPMRLNQVVEEALELVAYPLRVDNVEVATELSPELPSLYADPHQLGQVVVNFLTNAHYALRSQAGARRITLRTRLASEAGRAVLEVEDTGPGIPSEVKARLFEPFFTTKPAGQGTGLGLSLCRGIVETHGGEVSVESEPGEGALFRVSLPLDVPRSPSSAAAQAEAARPPAPGARATRILVVDDEEPLRAILADVLAGEGHSVALAENGARALQALEAEAFDLVLADMRMPELDGPGLYRKATELRPELRQRFVFLTGDSLGPETSQFLESAACPTVGKPFSLDDALRVVRQALAAAEAR